MELATPTVHKSGNHLHVTHGDDKGLFVLFHYESVEIPFRSEAEGRPIFEDKAYVTIIFPGDNTRKTVRPVKTTSDANTPSDPERWPKQWAAFQAQSEQPATGTPLTEWAAITKSQAMMLKALHIHSVDQLAVVPDHAMNWMGAREMQQKAIAFLQQRDHGKEQISSLQEQLDAANAQREEQATQLADLQKQMAQLLAAQPQSAARKKPGPKPKTQPAGDAGKEPTP